MAIPHSDTARFEPAQVMEIAGALHELTVHLVKADDLERALDILVDTVRRSVPGASRCGVALLRDGHAVAISTDGPEATELDQAQYKLGEGPGLDAVRDRAMVESTDLTTETRWPQWSSLALAAGITGVLAVPLDVADSVVGSVNLYTESANGLADSAQLTGMLLGEHASLLLASVLERRGLAALTAELAAALRGDSPVGHAVGIVMAQRGCNADEALRVLTNAAATANVSIAVVAERLVAAVAHDPKP